MTIDEIIQSIQIIKAQAEWDYPLDWQIVLDGAIDTMRKYQQIQGIVKEWREVGLDYDSCDAMDNIERVINNGNDD